MGGVGVGLFLYLEDGIFLWFVGFVNVNGLFEVFIESVGGVEVVKGLGSVFYGLNVVYGFVNIIFVVLLDSKLVGFDILIGFYWLIKGFGFVLGLIGESVKVVCLRLDVYVVYDVGYCLDVGYD